MAFLAWYNLVFWVPIGISVVLIFFMVVAGLEYGGHAGDVVGHHDVGDHDLGHVHVGHDAHGDHDHEASHHGEESSIARALSILGIGRAPLSIVMMALFIFFGALGLMSNMVCQSLLLPAGLFFPISVAIALVGSVAVTGKVASVVGRYMPQYETYQTFRRDLVGRTGQVAMEVSQTSGVIQVYDQYHTLQQVDARTAQGTIAKGKEVIVEEYQPDGDFFIVSESGL